MTLRGSVRFNLWYTIRDEGFDGDPEWIFELQLNGDAIATTDAIASEKSTEEPVEVQTQTQLSGTIEAGASDTFSVYIQYRNAEDCDLYFDNITYFSGSAIEMDSVIIFEADGKVSAQFHDAWGLQWSSNGKYFCSVENAGMVTYGDDNTEVVDDKEVAGENSTYKTMRMTFKDIDTKDGAIVTITIAYGPAYNGTSEGWTYSFTKGGSGDSGGSDNGDDDFPIAMVGAGAGVGILTVVGVFLFMKKKKGEDDDYDEEYDDDYDEEYDEEEEVE